MPIPLIYFLMAWLVLAAIFGLVAIMASLQMLRYGVAGPGTTGVTFVFISVGLVVTLATSAYLTQVDWKQTVDPIGQAALTVPFARPSQTSP